MGRLRPLLVLVLLPTASAWGGKLFSRLLQSEADSEPDAEEQVPLTAVTGGDGGLPAFFTQASEDVWETDPVLKMANRLIKGEKFSVLADLVGATELEEVWKDPAVAHQIINSAPVFKILKPLKEIGGRRLQELTPDDVGVCPSVCACVCAVLVYACSGPGSRSKVVLTYSAGH
jgi:hypothetical protein